MANNTRSKKLLNDENYDSFKEAVLSAVTEILQHILLIMVKHTTTFLLGLQSTWVFLI